MSLQSTHDESPTGTNEFYRRTLHVLSDARVPFLVGGSHAFSHYARITRDTKDFDLFVRRADIDHALEELAHAGYRTEITFAHWLAKAHDGGDVVDLVFSQGNGVAMVDDEWFEHSVEAQVLGIPVKLIPAEELIFQKSFIMERERYDGADVVHLMQGQADQLDWERLERRFGPHWELLLSHLMFFSFVYPGERARIPRPLLERLLDRARGALDEPGDGERLCRGTLVSRSQYLIDIGPRGYHDARLAPRGGMTAEQIVYWTWAIGNIE
jgi:predicted nucleotidyltransferase